MPTLEERLATLELRMQQVEQTIHSGGSVTWPKSIRGRLHEVEQVIHAADALRDAAREMRRSRLHTWSARKQAALVLCALATAVAPYVLLFAHHG